jgi:hypothetical protein
MNDFTKEELIMLKHLALQNVNIFRQNSDCIELLSKIKELIENYCDHEFLPDCYCPNAKCECEKCGLKLWGKFKYYDFSEIVDLLEVDK